jgi:hypothetical protein
LILDLIPDLPEINLPPGGARSLSRRTGQCLMETMAIERSLPPPEANERAMLTGFLDFQRAPGLDFEVAFREAATASVADAFAVWQAECAGGDRGGQRYNGHAELLRERIHGGTGQ